MTDDDPNTQRYQRERDLQRRGVKIDDAKSISAHWDFVTGVLLPETLRLCRKVPQRCFLQALTITFTLGCRF